MKHHYDINKVEKSRFSDSQLNDMRRQKDDGLVGGTRVDFNHCIAVIINEADDVP